VQRSSDACGGARQQPINVANRAPMTSNLIQFPPLGSCEIDFEKPHALAAELRAMLGHKVKMIGNGFRAPLLVRGPVEELDCRPTEMSALGPKRIFTGVSK